MKKNGDNLDNYNTPSRRSFARFLYGGGTTVPNAEEDPESDERDLDNGIDIAVDSPKRSFAAAYLAHRGR